MQSHDLSFGSLPKKLVSISQTCHGPDNHDHKIGPAPAGQAESAHNTTLHWACSPDSAHLCDASRDEIEEEAKKINYVVCLCVYGYHPAQ